MSILIRGMEMPKSCNDCPCIDFDNDKYECAACGILKKPLPWKWVNSHGIDVIYLRPSNCPLVEVPTPHGRLIDADALKEKMKIVTRTAVQEIVEYDINAYKVDDAPTIIKSEE